MKEEREQRRRERQIRTGARGEKSIWERNEREAYSVYNLYTGTSAQKVSQTKSTQDSLINEDMLPTFPATYREVHNNTSKIMDMHPSEKDTASC